MFISTEVFNTNLTQRSFFNDVLIAATARDSGAVIVTENVKDFTVIARALDIRFRLPWP